MSWYRYVAGGIGVYAVALAGMVGYAHFTSTDEQVSEREERKNETAREAQEWQDLKDATATECFALNRTSLKCQHDLQARGLNRDQALSQCQPSVNAFQACVEKKTRLQHRRGFLEVKAQQSNSANQ
jgi:hypothetical protein